MKTERGDDGLPQGWRTASTQKLGASGSSKRAEQQTKCRTDGLNLDLTAVVPQDAANARTVVSNVQGERAKPRRTRARDGEKPGWKSRRKARLTRR